MKIAFVGPSLSGLVVESEGTILLPPVRQGDVFRATRDGASAIALIDGVFGDIPSVWHKEILYSLSLGVQVIGGASLGALRAAECAAFGMRAIGSIAADYISGVRTDDSDVCLAHCPAELDYLPLTEPLVDVEASLRQLEARGLISVPEHLALLRSARDLHFTERSVEALFSVLPTGRQEEAAAAYRQHGLSRKRLDAIEVLEALSALPDQRITPPTWSFVESPPWAAFVRKFTG